MIFFVFLRFFKKNHLVHLIRGYFEFILASIYQFSIHNGVAHFFMLTILCKIDSGSCNSVQILDTNPQLFFHLQQQRLIELIRNGKVEEALEFAQEELAPRGEENVNFIYELFVWVDSFKNDFLH